MTDFRLRPAVVSDKAGIYNLYRLVSQNTGGLARTYTEITSNYVENFINKALTSGIQLVIEDVPNKVILGEIHCYKLEPTVFSHVLSELTIAVHPDFQGQGLGKMLFGALLKKVTEERADILRIELIARESNQKAILFYQSLGFKIEGKLMNRIKTGGASFEADIPMAWMNSNFKFPHAG